jgi:hypothetical protein
VKAVQMDFLEGTSATASRAIEAFSAIPPSATKYLLRGVTRGGKTTIAALLAGASMRVIDVGGRYAYDIVQDVLSSPTSLNLGILRFRTPYSQTWYSCITSSFHGAPERRLS